MVTTETPVEDLATRITNRIEALGLTRKAVYTNAGMSQMTFDRRMARPEKFTIEELLGIAEPLQTSLSSLLGGAK